MPDTNTSFSLPTVFVMAAGFGKRLLPLTATTPKPLLPFQGELLIDHVLKALGGLGFSSIVVNTHHLSDQMHQHLQTFFPHVGVSYESEILETAGGVKNALKQVKGMSGDFLIVNPDVWWSHGWVDPLKMLLEAWKKSPQAEALLGLVSKELARGYEGKGDYDFDQPSHQASHPGKNQNSQVGKISWCKANPAPFIYGSICVMKRHLFESMPETYLSNKVLWDRCEGRGTLFGVRLPDVWWDLGTLSAYESASLALDQEL